MGYTLYIFCYNLARQPNKANAMCEQSDKIDALEVEHGWKEEQFDFILQFLRTILMKRKHS